MLDCQTSTIPYLWFSRCFFRFNCISTVFLFSISHGSSQSNAKLVILRKKLFPLSLPPFQAAVLLKTYHCLLFFLLVLQYFSFKQLFCYKHIIHLHINCESGKFSDDISRAHHYPWSTNCPKSCFSPRSVAQIFH